MTKRLLRDESQLECVVNEPQLIEELLDGDGTFPNSPLPLLLYREVISLPDGNGAALFEELFEANGWSGCWRNGIYPYHHYHSTAHEVLGIYRGSAKVQLGGERGVIREVRAGDVLVIPAGLAHKNLGASDDFGVVGGYPEGQDWDMNYGKAGERPTADKKIAGVPLPRMDPVYGTRGPLVQKWSAAWHA